MDQCTSQQQDDESFAEKFVAGGRDAVNERIIQAKRNIKEFIKNPPKYLAKLGYQTTFGKIKGGAQLLLEAGSLGRVPN